MARRKREEEQPVSSREGSLKIDRKTLPGSLDIGETLVDADRLGPPIVKIQGGPAQAEVIVYAVLRYVLDISAQSAMNRAIEEPGGSDFGRAYSGLLAHPLSEPMVAAAIESLVTSGTEVSVSNVKEVLKGMGRRILGFLENREE